GAALYALRGQIEANQTLYDAALEDYTQSVTLEPTPERFFNRGLLYQVQNNVEAALSDFSDAIALDGTNPVFYIYRGQLNASLLDLPAAGADYLDFFNLMSPPRVIPALQSGQALVMPMERGVVYSVPFTAQAGQFASAQAIGETSTIDPLMVLIDPAGNPLIGDDDGGGNLSALIFDYPIPEDGEYTLLVGHSLSGFTGNVRVQLRITDEPNN
ncbi:MAG: hypothetical protein ABI835_18415, partial [Chloroflexota bacterium]